MNSGASGFTPPLGFNHNMNLPPQMLIMSMQMPPNPLYFCQRGTQHPNGFGMHVPNQQFSQIYRQQQQQQQFNNNPQSFHQHPLPYPLMPQMMHPQQLNIFQQPGYSMVNTKNSQPKVKIENTDHIIKAQKPSTQVNVKIENTDHFVISQKPSIQANLLHLNGGKSSQLNTQVNQQGKDKQSISLQVPTQKPSEKQKSTQDQQHQAETDSTTGERVQTATEGDMNVRPTSKTVLQQDQQQSCKQEVSTKISILSLKRSCETMGILESEEPQLQKKVCGVSILKNNAMANNIEIDYSVEVVCQLRPKDRQKKSKQDYYNDSNYTKNLLKGFKRYVNRFGEQDGIVIAEFEAFFEGEPLNNELILKCFAHDQYNEAFSNFLSQDPTWWVTEAKIKDKEKQIAFFQLCQERNFSSIKTKRKSFQRPII